ncbi:MAG: diaminopropionate ammonia-lyase [Solirubrobacteraceae bacterium]|nr:diaminopropionate ammonia-lyase [Solirubrobacteraceae bacterium]
MSATRVVQSAALDNAAAQLAAARILPPAGFAEAQEAIAGWPGYERSPLVELPALARRLGLGTVHVKDEAGRFGLGSFKSLGGAYAVYLLLARAVAEARGVTPSAAELMTGSHRELTAAVTVTCTTDGNHGRSVAWGARALGCRCVIYLHEGVSAGREEAIRAYGAEIVRAGATYDDSTRICAADAERNGWRVVSDTATEGAPQPVVDIMQGYRVVAEEIRRQLPPGEPPTHVFLQVGCGGFAAAITAHLLSWLEDDAPTVVAVEPERAACLADSIEAGRPTVVGGDLETLMAGLSVGEVSWPAWEILAPATAAVVVIPDRAAEEAMRLLAGAPGGDRPIVSGESGAAGLAGLQAVVADDAARDALGLDQTSRVLLISTEGATDEAIYERIVGRSAESVAGAPVPSH